MWAYISHPFPWFIFSHFASLWTPANMPGLVKHSDFTAGKRKKKNGSGEKRLSCALTQHLGSEMELKWNYLIEQLEKQTETWSFYLMLFFCELDVRYAVKDRFKA